MKDSMYHGGDSRQFERRPYVEKVYYFLGSSDLREEKRPNLTARAIDISDMGMGIETDYPLAPGHMLWFNNGIGHGTGFVRWCLRQNGGYRAGVELRTVEQTLEPHKVAEDDVLAVSEEGADYYELLDSAAEQFNSELEQLEKRCSKPYENPGELLESTQKAFDDVLAVCQAFEEGVADATVIREARIAFREKTNPILSKSYCINRTRTWPQGYQGDYKTLEVLYKNAPLSQGVGYYLDLCAMGTQLAEAVRRRIRRLEYLLRDELLKRQTPSILNIACGSCRELMGIAPEIMDSGARITCIDMDNDALAFAQDRLSYAGILPQVELRKYNAIRMFDDETNMAEFGKQDIIYSVGLFDYLPDDFLIKLLRALYTLLNPGGKLIAAFKDADRYRSQDYHWIADWDGFLQRTGKDFLAILSEADVPSSRISEAREETGIIVFYTATK
ncbi:MAG TPA: methyltransferase [Thermodesulfovibrionales bacterium]|nr:methyltransferase [Thermodesulfovibrionales bacterium]